MSPWTTWQRCVKATESTWLPEEIALAPEWVQEEFLRSPEECRAWLESHQAPVQADAQRASGRRRRGRRRKEA